MIIKAIKTMLSAGAFALWSSMASAVPMGFDVQFDLTNPISLPGLGGVPIDEVSGMFYADPVPQAGPQVVDCFGIGDVLCEVSRMMFEVSNGGSSVATLDLFSTDPGNPLGNFTGTATGGFGTVDVIAGLDLIYDIQNGACAGVDDVICGAGIFSLGLDLTGDGATADDTTLLTVGFGDPFPWVANASSTINFVFDGGQQGCTSDCGTVNIDPKAVPTPATLLLVGLGLAGLGLRRRR